MAHSAKVRLRARTAFVMERLPLRLAAQAAGVAAATVRGWKRRALAEGDDWDAAREAAARVEEGLGSLTDQTLQDFAALFSRVTRDIRDGDMTPGEQASAMATAADAYAKMVRAAGGVDPKLSRMGVALDALKLLGEHVRKRHPDKAPALAEALDTFGPVLAERWG